MAQSNEEIQASDLNFQTPEGRKSFWLNIFSVWLGTTMEYVDFALYGLAAGLVFGDVFFPEQTPIIALLSSFATYAVGFLARPLGAIILGRVGDRHGRKVIMVITVGLMGVSTTALGLLPTYRQVGWLAPALLVFLRLCQGFGAGAELSGGAVMLAEFSPVQAPRCGRLAHRCRLQHGHTPRFFSLASSLDHAEGTAHDMGLANPLLDLNLHRFLCNLPAPLHAGKPRVHRIQAAQAARTGIGR